MIKKLRIAGLVILLSFCLAGCSLNGAARKAQRYIGEGNVHIKKAQKIGEEVSQVYSDNLRTQFKEADDLFARLGRKEKPSEVDSAAKQAKSKLEEIKGTVTDTQEKLAEGKRELRLAKKKFSQAKKLGFSDWQARYIGMLVSSLNARVKALDKYEEMFDVVLEFCDTRALYADRVAAAKKKVYGGDFKTTAEYKAYEQRYLTPVVDDLNEQSSKLANLQGEAEELISQADSLSQKADQLYRKKTR